MSETELERNAVCLHCGKRNTVHLQDREFECYDCGQTYDQVPCKDPREAAKASALDRKARGIEPGSMKSKRKEKS